MLLIYTIGAVTSGMPWLDHMGKFIDLLLALIYTTSISLLNKRVRIELLSLFSLKKNTAITKVAVVVTSMPIKP
ncbi:hypothetical protein Y032_0144g2443 [Ancylostoma ceylanicum]|uniref:Uncharacterized protein n=1 Tax=Ancylostoma ceylanicum TaxID=53326 RepID=A0A016T2X9_9BILA|nr:hypothetical protein Y032_0144g2443 [Ancylostoma ceylanicum]